MSLPTTVSMDGLPERITIYEVGPRDGLQNEKEVVPTDVKAEFVRRLLAAGLDTVETTSFVPPSWIPQLADAPALLEQLGEAGTGVRRPVLVPNERGLDNALAAFETTLQQGLAYERRLFHASLATDDQTEGMAAFVEKRDPNFTDS